MNSISTNKPEHTPEPWETDLIYVVASDPKGIHPDIYIAEIAHEDSEGLIASSAEQEANGHRIVACVNACEGISTEALEQGVIQEMLDVMKAYLSGTKEPDELACMIRTAFTKAQAGTIEKS